MTVRKNSIGKYLFAGTMLVMYVFPFVLMLINSVKTTNQFAMNPFSLPTDFNWENFTKAFKEMNYLKSLANTFIITFLSVAMVTVFGSMAAYIVSRKKWKIAKIIYFLMIASMVAPFQAYMIPLVKIYGGMLGMTDKLTMVAIIAVGLNLPFAIFLIRGFLNSIPIEIEEAAHIDGCTTTMTFFHIVLPMLKPILITLSVFIAMGVWNDYLVSSLFLFNQDKRTLALVIRVFMAEYSVDYAPMMAGLLLSVVPVLIFYVFCQKHILEGVVQGSVKG